jgi:PAS domain S-box-containing protein
MRLGRLSILLAGGALCGLVGLTAYAAFTWSDLSKRLAEQRQVFEVFERAVKLSNALDYVTLLRADSRLLSAIRHDALALRNDLHDIDDAYARNAMKHLGEIEHLVDTLDPDASEPQVGPVTTQLRVHGSSLMSTLQSLTSERNRSLIELLFRVLLVFVIGAGTFGLLCVAGFTWVQQRLRQPLRRLEAGIQAQIAGDLDSRVEASSDDELGELARHLNTMAVQRQRDEQALRNSEERFRQLAENIAEVFWLTDARKTEIFYVSPSYETVWGRSRETLYTNPGEWEAAIHPADRERVGKAARSQALGGYQELYRLVRPDGSERWISDRAFPVRDETGRVTRIAGLAEDVTERVTADLQLRERMKELRCLYQVLELTTGNHRPLASVYEDIAGLLPGSMSHDQDAVARIQIEGDVFYSPNWREPVALLEAEIRPNGDRVGAVAVGYINPHDAVSGDGEPFLQEERTLMQGVAAHIARMLHHRRVSESLEQTQRLESVGQLTGGVAHDFNNLLTVIIGNAELLKEMLGHDPRLTGTADLIVSAAQRGAALTHRLLAFARRQPLEPRTLDVNDLIASIDPLLRRTLGEHIDIEFIEGGGIWRALADPAQLENALLNLALNARDAMAEGGRLTIETANVALNDEYVTLYPELAAGDYVQIAVTDTGSGIAPDQIARVFEPFYTTKEAGKGTGLGLSMVYGFVKQSGGHVNIYSEPGHGTTVKMYLPRAHGPSSAEAAPAERAALGGCETILLVEDDDLVREYASAQLADLGYRVLVAADGPSALALLERNPDIDLLFTDVIMPGGMSGRDLADVVQRERNHIRVLYTSGYTEDAIVHQGRLDPGVRLLNKPYRRAELAASVRRTLDADH